jgi:hypothetical protein
VLGWSDYQVRNDTAIRRHWQLVCLAFSFCWWAYGRLPIPSPGDTSERPEGDLRRGDWAARGKKQIPGLMAGDLGGDEGVAGTVREAMALL